MSCFSSRVFLCFRLKLWHFPHCKTLYCQNGFSCFLCWIRTNVWMPVAYENTRSAQLSSHTSAWAWHTLTYTQTSIAVLQRRSFTWDRCDWEGTRVGSVFGESRNHLHCGITGDGCERVRMVRTPQGQKLVGLSCRRLCASQTLDTYCCYLHTLIC